MRSYGNNAFYYANPGRARKSRVDLKSQLDDLNMDLSAINQEYPAERVWAASWAAFRINGFEYIRDYQQSGKMMNKALMLQLLQNTYEGDSITDDDIATGKDLQDLVQWTKFTGAEWTADSKGFYYMRYPEPAANVTLKAANNGAKPLHN